jgi:HPt (histidine-containing phosphotransfer) domain-containing protein
MMPFKPLAPGPKVSPSWPPKLPDLPKLPMADALPKPGELADQYFEFAQQLLTSQQKFVEKLIAALPSQDKTST